MFLSVCRLSVSLMTVSWLLWKKAPSMFSDSVCVSLSILGFLGEFHTEINFPPSDSQCPCSQLYLRDSFTAPNPSPLARCPASSVAQAQSPTSHYPREFLYKEVEVREQAEGHLRVGGSQSTPKQARLLPSGQSDIPPAQLASSSSKHSWELAS